MDPRALVIHLESPYSAYEPKVASAREVILAGLQWSNDHWSSLALSWLEDGAPVDQEIAWQLEKISSSSSLSQGLRHRAFALARKYTRAQPIEELDVVRVIALREKEREFSGTEGVKRAPQIGDLGAVVHVHSTGEAEAAFIVEAVDPDGYTLWVADFLESELKPEVKYRERT